MNCKSRLRELEQKGIHYHKLVADFISEKLLSVYQPKSAAILVCGDNDMLISYLLSKNFLIHTLSPNAEHPSDTHRIKIVDIDTFPITEYDVIIGIFCDENFMRNFILPDSNFFIIPKYSTSRDMNKYAREFFISEGISFEETVFDAQMNNNHAFFNFDC